MKRRDGSVKSGGNSPALKLDWTVGLQLLDTTWRVALPILLLTYFGHKLDVGLGTNPLFIMIGLFLSLAVSALLVYRQVQTAYPDFFKKVTK